MYIAMLSTFTLLGVFSEVKSVLQMFQVYVPDNLNGLSFSQVSLHYKYTLCYWRHIDATFLAILDSSGSRMTGVRTGHIIKNRVQMTSITINAFK
jgi:hypothetical protein